MFDKNSGPSDHERGSARGEIERRLFVARAIELAAVAPLAALGINNAMDHRDYATIDSQAALQGQVAMSPQLLKMSQNFSQLGSALESLESAYRDAYHKSRIVPYITTDSKGRMQTRFRTEYYWDEERSVPDHSTIDAWSSSKSGVAAKINALSSPELIDSARVNQLLVKTQHVGSLSQIGGSLVIYGAQIAAVLGYEEVMGLRENNQGSDREMTESKEQVRRGFFKSCASVLGLGTAVVVASKISSRLSSGKERMNDAVEKAQDQASVENNAAFTGHFQATPEGLISEIAQQRHQIELSLNSGVTSQGVRTAMTNFKNTALAVEESLKLNFSDGILTPLADNCKSAILTETINKARSGESGLGETAVLLEGLSAGGIMAATIISLEVADAYVAKRNQST